MKPPDHVHVTRTPPAPTDRIQAIDMMRGIVMILMVLDHVGRLQVSSARFDFSDLAATTPAYFFTRWATHFVAPAFVFLAGVAAYLYGSRPGRSKAEVSKFLWTRGLWLLVVEWLIVKFAWYHSLNPAFVELQVIAAIGFSMIALAALVHLPWKWLLAIGVTIVVLHNLLDLLDPVFEQRFGQQFWQDPDLPWWGWAWMALHATGGVRPGGAEALDPSWSITFYYPVLPWLGVMLLGYVFGRLYRTDPSTRTRWCMWLGGMMVVAFLGLRSLNFYGDPEPWSSQNRGGLFTFLSYLNVTKYPPSLAYLLMTLGPTIFVLPVLEKTKGFLADALTRIGRVPLLFYVTHLYVAVIVGWLVMLAQGHGGGWWWGPGWWLDSPAGAGVGLPLVFVLTTGILFVIYPFMVRFGEYRKRHRDKKWLSYV